MNRDEWLELARERVGDAKMLLKSRRWSAAYYMAGYAIECALKARILVRLANEPELMFGDRRFSEKCWTHNLIQLLDLTGLRPAFDADCASDPLLAENWDELKEWSEASRYATTPKVEATNLFKAITDKKHGVFEWIRQRC